MTTKDLSQEYKFILTLEKMNTACRVTMTNHTITTMDANKAFAGIKHSRMIKPFGTLRIEKNCFY